VLDDVGRLVLGTAALGLPYGLSGPAAKTPTLVARSAAVELIRCALEAGLYGCDTAPAYGEAEERIGEAVPGEGRVWSKLSFDAAQGAVAAELRARLGASLARLRRDSLDLLSWHNWTPAIGARPAFGELWRALRAEARVHALGATTYGAPDALAAVQSGFFEVVQVEWSLLNQGVLRAIASAARARGVKIALRSVFLKGVLTSRGHVLPARLLGLRPAVARARELASAWNMELAELALRAALAQRADWVVIGVDSRAQLDAALGAARQPRLEAEQLSALDGLDRGDLALTDPRTWDGP
jgi:aryl-alcohol dehydrogenase-like predicted oxidoreductase